MMSWVSYNFGNYILISLRLNPETFSWHWLNFMVIFVSVFEKFKIYEVKKKKTTKLNV